MKAIYEIIELNDVITTSDPVDGPTCDDELPEL